MTSQVRRRPSATGRFIMGLQVFPLRRNRLGRLGEFVMTITTTGRRTGHKYFTPIGHLRDGGTFISLSLRGQSNWCKNLLHNPQAELNLLRHIGRPPAPRIQLNITSIPAALPPVPK